LIITVEHVVFEFRIYVELDAESTDVRLAGEAFHVQPGPSAPPAEFPAGEPVHYTAYDRVDDRVFPSPFDVPAAEVYRES